MAPALPAVALGLVPLILLRWRIIALSLGDEEAWSLASRHQPSVRPLGRLGHPAFVAQQDGDPVPVQPHR